MLVFQIPLLAIAIAIAAPCAVLLLECLGALMARSTPAIESDDTFSVAVLMPAHNESAVIADTLSALLPQLRSQDRLLVVADNCTDKTAQIARQVGATVIERCDEVLRGKGYALDCGLRFLSASPPAAIVMVDADCQFRQGSVRDLAQEAIAANRPVQGVYLLDKLAAPSLKESVSAFAFKVKNLVRPLGLKQLDCACLLTGTGMAFPWSVISNIDLASGSIVEDMKLGFDLAIAGKPPLLCPSVTVVGPIPPTDEAAKTQRTRWEHGHLQLISRYCPQLLTQSITQGRPSLFAMAMDLIIPPLSLLVMLWASTSVVLTLTAWLSGFWLPAWICYFAGLGLMLTVVLAWAGFAQSDLPFKSLLSVPFYILWKIPVYLKFVTDPQVEWVRTRRQVQRNK